MILLELFWTFFKIGAMTFGGGYAMLPLIMSEVTGKAWIDEQSLLNFVAVSESSPGPFAINMATYVGAEMGQTLGIHPALGGFFGSFCATLGVVLPSFIIILIVAKFYMQFKNSKTVKGVMTGLKPAVIGLIGSAVFTTGKTVFFAAGIKFATLISWPFLISFALFLLTLYLALKKVHPIWLVVLSAGIGIAAGYALGLPV